MKKYGIRVYGITGGAGTGKSEVLRILREVFDGCTILSDDVARDLQKKGRPCYELMVAHFGEEILGEDGEIDRAVVAKKVFGNDQELALLNGMIHPAVRKEIERIVEEAAREGKYRFVALESAILLDCGYEDLCDEFWYVYTQPQIRRERMKASRNYSDERVDAVMASQRPDSYFMSRCQFVIENNGSLEEVKEQLKHKLSGDEDR